MLWQLTDNQLLKLDGDADEKMQAVINGIKLARSCGADIPLVGEVLAAAQSAGWLKVMKSWGRWCKVCSKSAGYAKFKGNGRHHKKGDPNHDKPLTMAGVSFVTSNITMRDTIDCCCECDTSKSISASITDLILSKQLPVELVGNPRNRLKKDDQRKCFGCGELMYESEMGKLDTLMGNGKYPATCPKCGSKSLLFGASHSFTGKFRLLATEAVQ